MEGPICSTRTLASCVYLSPKNASAPDFTADSGSISFVRASWFSYTSWLTRRSISIRCSSLSGW